MFALGLFKDGKTPHITTDGILATFNLSPGSTTVTPLTFAAGVTISPVTTPVPGPSTSMLFAAAFLALGASWLLGRRVRA
ncbi:MAG: hypothetical protein JOY85_23045 [Acidobacteriaceae bacterium]|nr:hypothetical protein [Acidobacteriaceae bacterium]